MATLGTSEPATSDAGQNRASDRIEEELRRMIVSMELSPGVLVSQAYLTERLGCGRTPLREALQRLARESLVTSIPGGGFAVAGLSVVDYLNVIEALQSIEPFAVRLAAKRIKSADLARLSEILDRAEQANGDGDFPAITLCDSEFHRTIAETTGNPYLIDGCACLHQLASRFGCVFWQRAGSATVSLNEHRQVLEALRAGDADEAERLARAHTLTASQRIVAAL